MIVPACLTLLCSSVTAAFSGPADFQSPVPVDIEGYEGHAMEPFLSRDGAWLFFNNRNQPNDQTDLHVAARLDEVTFRYEGLLTGANSNALDGVPSMDSAGAFYFISPRAYDSSRNTLWQGIFANGYVTSIRQVMGDASRNQPLWLNIDAEISADGQSLYFAENRWDILRSQPASSNILVAHKDENGTFIRPDNAAELFAEVNTDLLEFAPSLTADELTLYFTRVDREALAKGAEFGFGIYVSTRETVDKPFGPPKKIEALTGYVEAPTLSSDECVIYFHKRVDDVFQIQRATRRGCTE